MATAHDNVDYAEDRPGAGWWRHGWLERRIWFIHLGKLRLVHLRGVMPMC